MSLILNGTTGISDVDGTAAAPALTGTDSNTGIFFPAADQVAISTGGTQRAVVDASGNVGIGTSSPTNKLHVSSSSFETIKLQGTSTVSGINFVNSASSNGYIYYDNGPNMLFYTNNTERMRIDSSGEVLIGNSTASQTMDGLFVRGKRTATGNQYNFLVYTQGGDMSFACRDDNYVRSPSMYSRTSSGAANVFVDSSGYLYRSTSSIKYKRDVTDYDKGVSTVMQLRPVYYKSKVNDPDGNQIDTQYAGFIAEEVDALGLDEFVVKNTEGEVEAIHYGNMVALLTKTIQEQQALITSLTARIAALEGAA